MLFSSLLAFLRDRKNGSKAGENCKIGSSMGRRQWALISSTMHAVRSSPRATEESQQIQVSR